MKLQKYMLFTAILVLINGCSGVGFLESNAVIYDGPLLVSEEGPIPGVPPTVNYADFWVRNAENSDDIIMTPEEIDRFNDANPLNRTTYLLDVLDLPDESTGENVRAYISSNARYLEHATLYVTGEVPLEQAQRHRIIALMDTLGVPDIITLKFGVVLRRVEGKTWPTIMLLMGTPNDIEFDSNIVSSMDMGDPVALLHVSRDGLWSYVQHSQYTCWIPSDAVAFGDKEIVRTLVSKADFLMATGHRVSVYGTPGSGTALGAIQMGSTLPLSTVGSDYCGVLIPGRGELGELVVKKGFVRRDSNVSLGFLPYTLRNVYTQCFRLYGRKYGWSGMYEERDCSGYVMDVFRCFGFRLPRNSSRQAEVSHAVISLEGMDRETRLQAVRNSPGGISLLRMPGHIMIYLGQADGTPYTIHDFWAWREPAVEGLDVTHRAARIAVTDLLLGDGSIRGSFIDRLTHITILGNYIIVNQ